MSIKQDFTYPSADGLTSIHATAWLPETEPRAVVQLCHGMAEYIARYAPFAEHLTRYGFAVVGNDHLGHGQSLCAAHGNVLGYFADERGSRVLIDDMHTLRTLTSEKYPGLPYFMLGHSMGSFMTRRYIIDRGEGLSGVIIMGTGSQPGIAVGLGKFVTSFSALFGGWKKHSRLVDYLAFGSYNKKFSKNVGGYDWLSKDLELISAYDGDPLCGFRFTVNGYYGMFEAIGYVQNRKNLSRMRKDLPVLLVSGADDPVGAYGKGVLTAEKLLRDAGVRDLTVKLYPNDRHEILNETDRAEVFEDLRLWYESKMQQP